MPRKTKRILLFIALLGIIPAVGYGIMHALAFMLPMSETSTFSHITFTVILIALGLLVPYAMLKSLGAAAHEQNQNEKSFTLSDLPKDKQQFDNNR